MILEKKENVDCETSELIVEAYYDSTNIIKSIFLPAKKSLFIIFKKGIVYSYQNIDEELYAEFENSKSQGVFFNEKIKKNTKYVYYKEYKLYEFEKKEIFELINEKIQLLEEKNNNI
jgi:hypothetical protein